MDLPSLAAFCFLLSALCFHTCGRVRICRLDAEFTTCEPDRPTPETVLVIRIDERGVQLAVSSFGPDAGVSSRRFRVRRVVACCCCPPCSSSPISSHHAVLTYVIPSYPGGNAIGSRLRSHGFPIALTLVIMFLWFIQERVIVLSNRLYMQNLVRTTRLIAVRGLSECGPSCCVVRDPLAQTDFSIPPMIEGFRSQLFQVTDW